jgi:hypothetical protein
MREYRAGTFLECIMMAKTDGWLIEKGPELRDGEELNCAYCPLCTTGVDWDEPLIRETF